MKSASIPPGLMAATLAICAALPGPLSAADAKSGQRERRTFATPAQAAQELQSAAADGNTAAFPEFFGPEYNNFETGDAVQDAINARKLAANLAESCVPAPDGSRTYVMEIGKNHWPLAYPLVKSRNRWHFTTPDEKDEVLSEHIGEDEFQAVDFCRAYVGAQRTYALEHKDAGGALYAAQLKSTSPGAQDGLCWESAPGTPAGPLEKIAVAAQAAGYAPDFGDPPHPYHGYYFKVLSRQGADAPGGKRDYMVGGVMRGGFALVAWPMNWGRSGVMTFVVNQDGHIYQRNLGPKTARLAPAIDEYNPTRQWRLIENTGVVSAVRFDGAK